MPTNIKDYSTTQASNTSLNGISVAEGMLPSNLNNALRALMKNTRDWYNEAEWIEYGDGTGSYTSSYASATSFTIAGADVTGVYHANRRIKVIAPTPGTIYGTISSSSFSTNTTVNVTWDSGNLSNEAITNIFIAAISKNNTSIPDSVISTTKLIDAAVTTAKLGADSVTNAKIADDSIDSEHYVDGSIDTAHIADSQVTTAKIADTAITTAKITDANVTTAKIAADAITNAKIADDSIDSEQYVDGSIDTAHIADSQITTAKLADNSVTSAKIVDGSIVNADVNASAAIDATKIHDGTISNTEFGYLNGVTSAIQTQIDTKLTASNNLSDLGNVSTARTNLGVAIGSDVQAHDTELDALAGLTSAADKGIQFTGSGTAATYDLTTAGKALLDDADASAQRTTLGLGTISTQDANNVAVTGGSVTGLGSPSAGSDAATKTYVDNLVAGLKTRIIVRAATTANIDLTADLQNGDTLDGLTLATGEKVLVKNQTDASENGIYDVVASGTATRNSDYDAIAELAGQIVVVQEGTTNADTIYLCTTDTSATLGSSNITFTIITPANVGTVTSVGVSDAGSSEFTVTNSPITSSGTITLAVNSINATKIGNGDVDNTELSYVNGVTSAIQTQIDTKASNGFSIAMAIAL